MTTSYFSDLWESIKCIFQPDHWCELCHTIIENPLFKWLIAAIIFYIIYKIFQIRRNKILRVYTNNRGLVYIKKSALKSLIKKVCRTVVVQSDARVKICTCWRKIYVKVVISSPHDVQPTSIQLQQEIHRVLQEEVGLKNLGRIDVVVNHIYGQVKAEPLCARSQETIYPPKIEEQFPVDDNISNDQE